MIAITMQRDHYYCILRWIPSEWLIDIRVVCRGWRAVINELLVERHWHVPLYRSDLWAMREVSWARDIRISAGMLRGLPRGGRWPLRSVWVEGSVKDDELFYLSVDLESLHLALREELIERNFSCFTNLRELDVFGLRAAREIVLIDPPPLLHRLTVRELEEDGPDEIPPIPDTVHELQWESYANIPSLETLTNLEKLVWGKDEMQPMVEEIRKISCLTGLRSLQLASPVDILILNQLTNLEDLQVNATYGREDLQLPLLRRFKCATWRKTWSLPQLERLRLARVMGDIDLEPCPGLRRLTLYGTNSARIGPRFDLRALTRLETLRIEELPYGEIYTAGPLRRLTLAFMDVNQLPVADRLVLYRTNVPKALLVAGCYTLVLRRCDNYDLSETMVRDLWTDSALAGSLPPLLRRLHIADRTVWDEMSSEDKARCENLEHLCVVHGPSWPMSEHPVTTHKWCGTEKHVRSFR